MEQTIYGDILLLINFSMDFLSLYLAAKLLHQPIRTIPMILASGIGAFYALLSLWLHTGNLAITFLNIAVSCAMVAVAFLPRRLGLFLKSAAVFYGISFLLGGCMTAVYNLCNSFLFSDRVHAFGNVSNLETELSFGWFVLLAAVSAVASLLLGRLFTRSATQRTAQITAALAGREVKLTLLCDSGNLLCDPISGTPVLICAFHAIEPILYYQLRAFFADPIPDRIALLRRDAARRVRVIPMKGVGESGMLFAFRPDRLSIGETAIDALIAVDTRRGTGEFGGTDGLLPAALTEQCTTPKGRHA